jgi:CheY-like chemotaxis protein
MGKVIIAEDERLSAVLISRVVEESGHTPVLCSDGMRALFILRDNPDAVALVSDYAMPNMNGLELLQALRADPLFVELPVILVSGVITLREIRLLLLNGATRFLPKPIELSMLRYYLSTLLSDPRAERKSVG